MKFKINLLALAVLAVATIGAGSTESVRVLRVVSGNTIIVISKDKEKTVRLLRIKTPDKDRPGHKEAADFLSGLVDGKTVSLQFEDPGRAERDSGGSIPAYIILDNKNINVEIVRAGWSPVMKSSGEGRYAEEYDIIRQAQKYME